MALEPDGRQTEPLANGRAAMNGPARASRDRQVVAAYQRQPSLRTIAKLFSLSHEGIRKILIAQDVEIAPACTWNNPIAGDGSSESHSRFDACVGRPSPSGAATPFSGGVSPIPTVESPGRLPSPADRGTHE